MLGPFVLTFSRRSAQSIRAHLGYDNVRKQQVIHKVPLNKLKRPLSPGRGECISQHQEKGVDVLPVLGSPVMISEPRYELRLA